MIQSLDVIHKLLYFYWYSCSRILGWFLFYQEKRKSHGGGELKRQILRQAQDDKHDEKA